MDDLFPCLSLSWIFFFIIPFGISFVATCAYFLLLVVHLQELFPSYFQPSVRSFETIVSVPLSYYPSHDWQLFQLFCLHLYVSLIILMIFCCSHSKIPIFFLKWKNPYKILQILLPESGEISPWEGSRGKWPLLLLAAGSSLGTLLEEMFSLCCLVMVIMESLRRLWMIKGIFFCVL